MKRTTGTNGDINDIVEIKEGRSKVTLCSPRSDEGSNSEIPVGGGSYDAFAIECNGVLESAITPGRTERCPAKPFLFHRNLMP